MAPPNQALNQDASPAALARRPLDAVSLVRKALGVTFPQSLLLRADEIIQ